VGWFERQLSLIEDGLHILGCVSLVIIAVLINADIISRLAFKIPIQFQFELVEYYLMPAVATLSLSRVFREGGHLSLDIIQPETFGRAWPAVRMLMLVFSTLFFLAVTAMSGRFTLRAFMHDDVYFGYVNWPLGWAYLCVPVGCAVLTTRLLFELTKRGAEGTAIHHQVQ
jgi:TRAP-type C4-dicarboxylate transport system permease small subunit